MHITYTGKIIEDGNEYSSFLLGTVNSAWISEFKREVEIQFFDHTNYIHYLMVRYYVRTRMPELWKWVYKVDLPFGAEVHTVPDGHQLTLLLQSGSAEETAFKLRFNITESN